MSISSVPCGSSTCFGTGRSGNGACGAFCWVRFRWSLTPSILLFGIGEYAALSYPVKEGLAVLGGCGICHPGARAVAARIVGLASLWSLTCEMWATGAQQF